VLETACSPKSRRIKTNLLQIMLRVTNKTITTEDPPSGGDDVVGMVGMELFFMSF
jgi:hypothetical protein